MGMHVARIVRHVISRTAVRSRGVGQPSVVRVSGSWMPSHTGRRHGSSTTIGWLLAADMASGRRIGSCMR